ncbi:hypothetical protein [Hydrogenophaga sp.]|uniref:hypothetical protein n=1 Tax=Hydrogenophaga sp. TaxID=1904254 RepID=UPI0025BBA689|nr:hypothetical protein [Hydrogenophaga sp.]MBT9466272.1 hypothetical protein [Hydrogenophaga sp.]
MSADYVRVRRRASPEAKWLVNELAALRGQLESVRERLETLRQKETNLEKRIASIELVASKVRLPEGSDPPITIRPWERYGKRGSLSKLLMATLEEAYPKGVTTNEFIDRVMASSSFSKDFSLRDMRGIRDSVLRRLKHLRQAGKLERLGQIGLKSNGLAVWGLVNRNAVSLGALHELAQSAQDAGVSESV